MDRGELPSDQVTLGGYYGGHPASQKNGPFFRKTRRKRTKYTSTQVLGEPTWDAGG
jgi:hypothetical protein